MARPYHHGNLKEALLQAAVELVGEAGPSGFTLRELARRAGVSHNAPYRHYKDREALLAEVACQGFEELVGAIYAAVSKESEPLGQFRAAGRAYVKFALRRPEHYAVMFDRMPEEPDPYPQRTQAAERAFDSLVQLVVLSQAAGAIVEDDSEMLARQAWALCHGIAKLGIGGFLKTSKASEILAFTDATIQSALIGLVPKSGTKA